MSDYYKSTISKLDDQLDIISLEFENPIQRAEQAIDIILKTLNKLKGQLLKNEFTSIEQEIDFFKKTKPKVLSKLIYYNSVYKIETRKPHGGEKVLRKYLSDEFYSLKRFFDNNLEFYKYYRTGSTYLDTTYFVRGNHDIKLNLDAFYFEADHRFTTSHDYKVAEIIAHDAIQLYLEEEQEKLNRKSMMEKFNQNHKRKQTWTASKVALIELLFALHSEGVFNNGTSDLKEIAEYFEDIFGLDLGQYHRVFLEIQARKSDRTKFLNILKNKLIKRMDGTEGAA